MANQCLQVFVLFRQEPLCIAAQNHRQILGEKKEKHSPLRPQPMNSYTGFVHILYPT